MIKRSPNSEGADCNEMISVKAIKSKDVQSRLSLGEAQLIELVAGQAQLIELVIESLRRAQLIE